MIRSGKTGGKCCTIVVPANGSAREIMYGVDLYGFIKSIVV